MFLARINHRTEGKITAAVKVRKLQGTLDRDVSDFCLEACLLHAASHPYVHLRKVAMHSLHTA